jgi:3-methyladenine DNA glycosylase AlkD
MTTSSELLAILRSKANPKNVEGMARFGISAKNTLGISVVELRAIAKKAGHDHQVAQELWKSGIHEARILAAYVAEPAKVTEKLMDQWVKDFDSWDVCDQVCANLFDRTPYAYAKAREWAKNEREFVRRAGFALMACLAWHDKKAQDRAFEPFFPLIKRYAVDERNFVKKAVNWALRQIGKRSPALRARAIAVAKEIEAMDSKAARWVAKDALRELQKAK